MILYEVNLEVQAAVADAFAEWLPGHIRQILALPGFVKAEWFEEDPPGEGVRRWRVQYLLVDAAALERYLDAFAGPMRADGEARFGGQFSASRRVLRPLRSFDAGPRGAPARRPRT